MESPLISVIIPVYNVEKYLPRCLESIRNQTYANLEILLIDDGSQDASAKICEQFAVADNRFSVVHQPNSGVSCARNKGLDLCHGEYIAFIDADDYVSLAYLEKLYYLLSQQNAMIGNIENGLPSRYNNKPFKPRIQAIKNYQLHRHYSKYTVWGMLFHRNLLKNNLRFRTDLTYYEDYIFKIHLLCNNENGRYAISNEVLYYHETARQDSLVSKATKELLHQQRLLVHTELLQLQKANKRITYLVANSLLTIQKYYVIRKETHNKIYKNARSDARGLWWKTVFSDAPLPIKIRFCCIYFRLVV